MEIDSSVPQIGEEREPPEEKALIEHLKQAILARLEKRYPPNALTVRRDAHPKTHGCVRAEFTVTDAVPEALRYGVFQSPQTFKAWIRFSSGRPVTHSDKEADTQGMAMKLMGVDGEKILRGDAAEKRTQDFVMASSPTFFIRNMEEYIAFETEEFQNLPDGLLKKLDMAKHFILRGQIQELLTVQRSQAQKVSNPLQIRYWSQTPYKMGPGAVKFTALPVPSTQDFALENPDDDFLQTAMTNHLQGEDAIFDFMAQVQTDAAAMPIEDPVVNWDEDVSPFQKVATIRIPRQTFDSREQFRFAENLSFTPWHCLPEHRPLGGINRARRVVYEAISEYRHAMNGAERPEPTGEEAGP